MLLDEPTAGMTHDDVERIAHTVRFTLFEVAFSHSHLVGHMREAQHMTTARAGEGVQRGSLHFDRQCTLFTRKCDGLLGFAIWGIGRPRHAAMHRSPQLLERRPRTVEQRAVAVGEG